MAGDARAQTPPPLPAHLRERVLDAVKAEPAPTRTTRRAYDALLLSGAAVLVLADFIGWGGFREWGAPRPGSLIALTVVIAAGLAGVAIWGAVGKGGSMVGHSRRTLIAVALGVPVFLFVSKVALSALYPHMLDIFPPRLGLKCLTLGTTMGVFPLLALAVIRKRSEPNHPTLTGIGFGVMGGAVAWVFVDLWCPVGYIPHLLLGHVLPIVILSALGAVVGTTLLGLRART